MLSVPQFSRNETAFPAISIQPPLPSRRARVFVFFILHLSNGVPPTNPLSQSIQSLSLANRGTSFSFATHSSPCGQPTLISTASICCPPITDNCSYGSIFEIDMQSSKPPASSDGQPLDFPALLQPAD